MTRARSRTKSRDGFSIVKTILLVACIVGLMIYFRASVEKLWDGESRARTIRILDAKADRFWYGFLVWYDVQTQRSRPIGWIQEKIDGFIQSERPPTEEVTADQSADTDDATPSS